MRPDVPLSRSQHLPEAEGRGYGRDIDHIGKHKNQRKFHQPNQESFKSLTGFQKYLALSTLCIAKTNHKAVLTT